MIAGQLEIQLLANMAQLQSDMEAAKKTVSSAMDDIKSTVSSAKKVLEGLGVAGGVDYFAGLISGAIEAQAHLDDLSKSTAITVEQLAGLKLAAQVSGANLDSAALSINRLSVNIGKNAEAFQALGISTKDPMQAFEQLADLLSSIEDPTLRAAVASQALGKGWQATAPLLMQGGAQIRALIDEGTRLSNVTAQSAAAANELNKHWLELVGSGGLLNATINNLVPQLDALIQRLIAIRDGDYWTKMRAGAQEAAQALPLPLQLAAIAMGLYSDKVTQAAKVNQDFAIWANAGDQVSRRQASDSAAAARAFLAHGQAVQTVVKASNDLANVLAQIDAKAGGFSKDFSKDAAILVEGFATGQIGAATLADSMGKLVEVQPPLVEAWKTQAAVVKAYVDQLTAAAQAQTAAINTLDDLTNALEDQATQLDAEIKSMGMSAADREKYLLDLKTELELRKALADPNLSDEAAAKKKQEILDEETKVKALIDQKQALTEQVALWNQVGDAVGTFFGDLATNGSKAFTDLRNQLKQFAAEIIAFFAKRFVLQMVASAGGGGLASTAANAAAGQMGSSALGSVLGSSASSGMFGSVISGAGVGLSGAFGTGVLTGAGDFVGTGLAGMAGNLALAAGATDTFAATVAAAVPVIGWIVAIGMVLYAIFGSKGGAPKNGGSFFGTFNEASGALLGTSGAPGTDTGRFYTPGDNDPQMQQFATSIGTGFAQTLAGLGGKANGGISFGFGFDMDPGGTANSRVSSEVVGPNGQVLFNQRNVDAGRSQDDLNTALSLEAQRAVLAALQSSDLPAAIHAYLNTLSASTASATDIQNILQGAQALKTLYNESASIEDVIKELADPSGVTALKDAFAALDKQVSDAKDAMTAAAQSDPQSFLAAEQAYKQAVLNRYQQEMQALETLRQAIRQVQSDAYNFAVSIAQKINSVGGSVDVGALAMGRASQLQGQITSGENASYQVQDVQDYVGAIDTWYQSQYSAIMADAQAAADAQNAVASAQASSAQARQQQLQTELDAVNNLKTVIDAAKQLSDQLALGTSNPLAASGRFNLIKQQVDALRAQYLGATSDTDKATIGQQLVQALTTEQQMAASTFQRPSDAYVAAYNQIQGDLALIGKDSQSIAQRQLDLTQRIADASAQAATYGGQTATAAQMASSQIDALNKQALGYYTLAEQQGQAAYALQETQYRTQLDALTNGTPIDIFEAQLQSNMADSLASIDSNIITFLSSIGVTPSTTTPSPTPTTVVPGGPGSGPDPANPTAPYPKSAPVIQMTFNGTPPTASELVDQIKRAAPAIKRALQVS